MEALAGLLGFSRAPFEYPAKNNFLISEFCRLLDKLVGDPKIRPIVLAQEIKGKLKIHPSLEKGFKAIYGYTSDGDGIRHALSDESNSDFEDAKFMLVSSSAFINYLIAKSNKAGLEVK